MLERLKKAYKTNEDIQHNIQHTFYYTILYCIYKLINKIGHNILRTYTGHTFLNIFLEGSK